MPSAVVEPLGRLGWVDDLTLSIDVGATSTKAALITADGLIASSIARRKTRYPLEPVGLVGTIVSLADSIGSPERVTVGFPGLVRSGVVISPANLARTAGPGTPVDDDLAALWNGFDLAGALREALGLEVRVANDADVAALACASGTGVELTVTLGSGVGTGLVVDGRLVPHLELSELSLEGAASLDNLVGERARKDLEPTEWDRRVVAVIELLDRIIRFDRCTVAGGNARRLHRDRLGRLLERVWVTVEDVGLTGGPRLYD